MTTRTRSPSLADARPRRETTALGSTLALLAAAGAVSGLLTGGGPGREVVTTARDAETTLYGHGLYASDTWLIGAGNQGQDVVLLLFEIPVLLLVLRWSVRGGPVADAVYAGVLSFLTYFYVSMVFGTAQNRLFPLYVAAATVAGAELVRVVSRLDVAGVARSLPGRPSPRVLSVYLLAVAGALVLAWLPATVATALTGDIAEHVGPYTSSVTEALDLGLVVPVAVFAAVQLRKEAALGRVLALVLLVVNVCIGMLLMGQGIAQLLSGVPLTTADLVARMATFAALTLVAGGLLLRMRLAGGGRLYAVDEHGTLSRT